MRKMMLIDDNDEEIEGYEFIDFAIWSELVDGHVDIYTVAICKDPDGYLGRHGIHKVKFVD